MACVTRVFKPDSYCGPNACRAHHRQASACGWQAFKQPALFRLRIKRRHRARMGRTGSGEIVDGKKVSFRCFSAWKMILRASSHHLPRAARITGKRFPSRCFTRAKISRCNGMCGANNAGRKRRKRWARASWWSWSFRNWVPCRWTASSARGPAAQGSTSFAAPHGRYRKRCRRISPAFLRMLPNLPVLKAAYRFK